MHAPAADDFRLCVLNPGGRDQAQDFPAGAGLPEARLHAPVNYHAYAACTRGSFERATESVLAHRNAAMLLLLRGDFRAAERALSELQQHGHAVAVALKETGAHQIAAQLGDARKFSAFARIVAAADGCIASTREAVELYRALRAGDDPETVAFVPTPYPVEEERWDFSVPFAERRGIFIGTREFFVPSRNHLAALLLARELSRRTNESVTVFNDDGRAGAKLLAALDFPPGSLRVLERRVAYPDYLREMARHRLVLQLDASAVPGQVAGDALLCRLPCAGGNGAIDRLAHPRTNGFAHTPEEIALVARRLLDDAEFYRATVSESEAAARAQVSFAVVRLRLAAFFRALRSSNPPAGAPAPAARN